jgi:hypothetical protein
VSWIAVSISVAAFAAPDVVDFLHCRGGDDHGYSQSARISQIESINHLFARYLTQRSHAMSCLHGGGIARRARRKSRGTIVDP